MLFVLVGISPNHDTRSSGVVVVRALTSHQCGPGSISKLGVIICELSLLILSSALRGFTPGTLVFPTSSKFDEI